MDIQKKIIDLEIIDAIPESGVSELALVDAPAIEKLWMAFKKELGGQEFEIEPNPCWEGYEPYGLKDDGTPNCIPIKAKELKFAETYTDYPEAAVNNAKRALEWADENGWGDCGMGAGKARANQLANREPISEETIARMSAFARHKQNSDTPYSEGCGKLMWDAWGGDAGINWAYNKLREIRGENFSYDVASLPNYVHQTGKKEKFSIQEDKKIVVGPVAIPNIEIIRQDPDTKEVYWVRFSTEVIQKIAEKFMRDNKNNETNLEHDTTTDAKSYVFESWIVEEATDKANTVYNLDVPVGTWCVKMRITDPTIWADVKAGKLNGFSLEGSFVSKEELDQYNKDREIYNNIVRILNSY